MSPVPEPPSPPAPSRTSTKGEPDALPSTASYAPAARHHDTTPTNPTATHPRWTVIVALNQGTLRRVQEDRPLVPRVVECALQFLHVGHHAEATVRVGMGERIGPNRHRLHDRRRDTSGQIEQRLGRL